MSCTRRLCTQIFGFTTAILVANGTLATAADGQTIPGELPTDCSGIRVALLYPQKQTELLPPRHSPLASYRPHRGYQPPGTFTLEARACAWQERLAQKADLGQNREEPTAWIVGGSLILADIYFNGADVKRNIPLAMRFACESEEGMATIALPDIVKLNGSPHAHGAFQFCDYAASTITMSFCSGYASEIEDDRRGRYYSSLKSSMTPEQQTAFEKLLAAKDAYIEAHANEVDQGGTIRGIRTVGSQNILKDLFHTEVVHFERKKWPVLSDNQISAADDLLHREYEKKLHKLRAQTKDSDRSGRGHD